MLDGGWMFLTMAKFVFAGKFCSLFWSPFEIDTPQYRTENGRVEELPASEDEEEPVSGER